MAEMTSRCLLVKVGTGQVTFHRDSPEAQPLGSCVIIRPKYLPFLKWAGGKQWLARVSHLLCPESFTGTYYEPFLGGGSVFFALNPERAILSDANRELIETYEAIASEIELVISALKSYSYDRDFYHAMRKNCPPTRHERAAKFIYLNKTAWNGLYRVNLKGEFNVPFGRYNNVTICPEERLREASRQLTKAHVICCDFEKATESASDGDLVYFDPPYITTHNNNGFRKYNSKLFSWTDQLRLSRLASGLREKGVHVVVSNADHQPLLDLYSGFFHYRVQRNSLIGGKLKSRGRTSEVLFTSFPLNNYPELTDGY